MSVIYIGRHTYQEHHFDVLECEMNSVYWDAFGVLLEEILLLKYPELYEKIARDEFTLFEYYTFTELSFSEFNFFIKIVRSYIPKLNISTWQEKDWITDISLVKSRAQQVWLELLEPLIIKDDRYDQLLFSPS